MRNIISKAIILLALMSSASAFARVNIIRVCNYRAETVWGSYATDRASAPFSGFSGLAGAIGGVAGGLPQPGPFKSYGWYAFEPSQCLDLVSNYSGLFKFFAYGSSGWTSGDAFGLDAVVSQAQVCVRLPVVHDNLDERVCQGSPAGSEYHFERGHLFNFTSTNFNVYEIGLYN